MLVNHFIIVAKQVHAADKNGVAPPDAIVSANAADNLLLSREFSQRANEISTHDMAATAAVKSGRPPHAPHLNGQ